LVAVGFVALLRIGCSYQFVVVFLVRRVIFIFAYIDVDVVIIVVVVTTPCGIIVVVIIDYY
jgi:hypothetical protein